MTAHARSTLPVENPRELITTVATLLRGEPKEMVVLLGVNETMIVIAATVSITDIATPGTLAGLFRTVRRGFATAVIALVYTDTRANTGLLAEPIAACAHWAGLGLLAALQVKDGELQPLTMSRPGQEPSELA